MITRKLFFLFAMLLMATLPTMAQDDIEVTDSTSTDWGGGTGGGIGIDTPDKPVTTLTLSEASVVLQIGQERQIVPTVNDDATNKNIVWTSSNEAIATVQADGTIKGIAPGTTTIVAASESDPDVKATCQVTVTDSYLSGDVNGDGQVGIGDIVAVTNVMAGTTADEAVKARADVNGDGQVGIGDIVAITNIMAGTY